MINSLNLRSFIAFSPLLGSAMAASSITYDFNSSSSGDLFEGAGVSGWSQANSNPTAFGQTFPLAYVSATDFGSGSSNSAHLGTQFANTPDNSDTTLTGDLSSVNPSNTMVASFSMAILDNAADSFEGRDGFSVALKTTAGQEAATIGFSPTAGDNEGWDVSVGVNGSTSTTPVQISSLTGYTFSVNASHTGTTFQYGATSANVLLATAAPITELDTVGFISFTHDPLADVGTSINTLAFDNVMVQIPEPSSSLLMILSAGLIAVRRRR
ncbi:PEP-CTERM sorting domain-containing protein [Akkermansiaceae bacterium]|nr:PEP-CTERM sorting domain-containing protein [Akkermansiaceae bacterium]MDB4479992.1 PEP-CTERM sorting domain-containing protein [Akkermansiaceae bacterium]